MVNKSLMLSHTSWPQRKTVGCGTSTHFSPCRGCRLQKKCWKATQQYTPLSIRCTFFINPFENCWQSPTSYKYRLSSLSSSLVQRHTTMASQSKYPACCSRKRPWCFCIAMRAVDLERRSTVPASSFSAMHKLKKKTFFYIFPCTCGTTRNSSITVLPLNCTRSARPQME